MKKKFLPPFLIPFLFIFSSFLIYLPVWNHYFVSDDFKVLYRVCIKQIFFIKGFFRPLSDISIFINYKLGALNPIVFNLFNILIHGINSYLLYLVCLYFGNTAGGVKKYPFAVVSSVIFLCYPFHNEAVVWLLGRGASMASLFSLLSVICFYRTENKSLKYILVCSFYFISLAAYESTVFLPMIFILLLIFEKRTVASIRIWALFLILTLILHIILRYWIAGSLLGSYGEDFFHSGAKGYILNTARVIWRLVMPPVQNIFILTVLFVLLTGMILLFVIKNYQKNKPDSSRRIILFLTCILFISCVIPIITGVSTQTSETDRMLYFPSIFLCMILGALITCKIKNLRNQFIITAVLILYGLFFLEKNNLNWRRASFISSSILGNVKENNRSQDKRRIFFLNVPREIEGAYVFRQGFREALLLNGYDSNRFIAVNYLTRQDLEKMKDKIILDTGNSEVALPPDILLRMDSSACRQIFDHGALQFTCLPGDLIFFWNLNNLQPVGACQDRIPGRAEIPL